MKQNAITCKSRQYYEYIFILKKIRIEYVSFLEFTMSLLSTLVSANTSFSHLKLLWSMYARSFTQLCLTLCHPNGLEPSRLLCQWNFPGRNTGVGCHFLLQGSSQHRDQSVSPCLLYWQAGSLPLSHLGSHYDPPRRVN